MDASLKAPLAAYPGLRPFAKGQVTRNPLSVFRQRLSLLGIAPGGGCLAADVATRAGGLLHLRRLRRRLRECFTFSHLFTLTVIPKTSVDAWKSLGGLFLWPDPGDLSPPEVIRHRTLWSADFPQLRINTTAITQSTRVPPIILASQSYVN